MITSEYSNPIGLKNVKVTDEFWQREMELVRKEVIPYQWEALNDRIPDAAPSFCMHNFKVAGKLMKTKREKGTSFVAPSYTYRGFETLPENPEQLEDQFYGFVFQDTDFSKWIEAVAYSLTQYPDERLERTADEAIEVVCAAQLENGYLDTYYIINGMDQAFTNLRDHHELYCLGHFVEGAVAYYEATGKDKLLKAACRFADYVADYFGEEAEKCKGYPGHEIAEMALVRLYQVTKDDKYVKLSRYFLMQRGTQPYYFDEEEAKRAEKENRKIKPNTDPMRYAYHQAHQPVKEQKEAVGHAVRAVYLYSGMADVARLTQDEQMYQACKQIWDSIIKEKLYVTGGIGGTHVGEAFSFPFDLPNDTAYSETCAAIGLAFFARRMLEIKADSQYGDVMEMALYNTVLSGMALDGKSFFYVNPLEVVPEACHKDQRKAHVKPIRQKWFGCACCPPNIARIVSSIASYAYTENESTLWTHLYMSSVIQKEFENGKMQITTKTQMPWNGASRVSVQTEYPVKATLAFRIPGWCNSDKAVYYMPPNIKKTIKDGYVYFEGTFQQGDEISLTFQMDVHMLKANTRVREDIGKVAFTRGPITYCMEEADNGKNLHLYQVDMDSLWDQEKQTFHAGKIKLQASDELGHFLYKINIPGKYVEETKQETLYTDFKNETQQSKTITLIPYYAWNNRGEGEMSVWLRT